MRQGSRFGSTFVADERFIWSSRLPSIISSANAFTRDQTIRPFKSMLLLTLATVLAGCGVQFLYNNLDTLISSQLDDYVDLTPEQQQYFEREFEGLWRWHRAEELPRYAADLETWAEIVDDGITDTEVDQVFERMQEWWRRVGVKGRPASKDFLTRLEDSQVLEIEQAFEKENVKWEKRSKADDIEFRRRKWAKNFERLVERFTGSLDREQQEILALGSQDYQPARELWGEYRLTWQREFLALLELRDDAEVFEGQFDLVFGPQQALYSDELREAQNRNEMLTRKLVLEVLQSMHVRQVKKFKDNLAARALEFRALSQEG